MWNQSLTPRFTPSHASGFGQYRLDGWRLAGPGLIGIVVASLLLAGSGLAWGQESAEKPAADTPPPAAASEPTVTEEPATEAPGADPEKKNEPPFQIPKTWRRVTKDYEVWIDFSKKQVIVGGQICLREGMLEMFACPKGTKEHESIVSVHSQARYVHAALVAVGAKPGPPVQFTPTYRPAQGTEVSVEVLWKNTAGEEQRTRAQEWVKHVKTGEELKYPWVFAGSGFWTDEEGKEQYYYGDGGEFICVSNFSTATLDLPVESSAANDTLMFSAFKDRIPPLETPVLLVLTPKLPEKDSDAAKDSTQPDNEKAPRDKQEPRDTHDPRDKQDTADKQNPGDKPKTDEKTEPAKEAATPTAPEEPGKTSPAEPDAPNPAEKDAPTKTNKEPSC